MKMNGEQLIAAPRDAVWAALNDPEVLKACIPGCQSLEKIDDEHMKAAAAIKVGPISARFAGEVTLSDRDPPNGYRISGEGSGGAAGFAKGGATVRLTDEVGGTKLSYDVDAQVGGKLAQLGGGLIDATAKQMAGAFFKKFGEIVAPAPAEAATPADALPPAVSSVETATIVLPKLPPAAVGALAIAAVLGFYLGRQGDSMSGLLAAILVIAVAAIAYNFGRKAR